MTKYNKYKYSSLNRIMNEIVKKGVVYRLTNTVTGDTYVGGTTRSLRTRWKYHKREANRGTQSPLYRAIREFGSIVFTREVIASVLDYYYLVDVENAIIKQESPTYNRGKPHKNQYTQNMQKRRITM